MKRINILAAASAIACLAGGEAGAAGLADQAGDPIVTSVNLASLQAIFDQAGVPATTERESDGFAYVASHLGGNLVAVVPQNCQNNDPTGDCASVTLMSGTWSSAMPAEDIARYAAKPKFASILTADPGKYLMRYSILVANGVGPKFIEGALVQFSMEMQDFVKVMNAADAAAGKPGFAAEPGLKGLSLTNGAIGDTGAPTRATGALTP